MTADLMVRAWAFDHDPAGGDAAKSSLKVGKVLDYALPDGRRRLHSLKVDLNGGLHKPSSS